MMPVLVSLLKAFPYVNEHDEERATLDTRQQIFRGMGTPKTSKHLSCQKSGVQHAKAVLLVQNLLTNA